MRFFDKIRSGNLFFGKTPPALILQFILNNREYIVEEFDLEFTQEVDSRNRPDSLPHGGLMTVTISDIPDTTINEWLVDTQKRQDGEFRFFLNEEKTSEGSILNIMFKDAYCIRYHKVVNPQGVGVLTTLVISPRYLRVGNEEYENNW